ncbi:uncharacterized protein TrAtP1_010394 [Trichoderma atroviride]|uniref:uncharacterized protein n=1 Tax=Hypocrea atroviridis TaxID=63577 RepID=UPI00331BD5E0|nr:hypothetical protein TrAtP1_010394 [Trichoderma atroviride]
MASVKKAEEIVRRLTRKYGYLNEEMMSDIEKWKPEYRREIDENWLAMENTAAHSIKTLAKQIYGSGARFVFELLQNAEDNNFSKTTEDPYISFEVYENRIVVECNEDGFTERDLVAICAVGQSTKSTSYGYIGAKGIGFKSVFIAAWKVHIQSGNFSFEFRHKRDDPGLGMVRPIWIPTNEKLKGPLTRMTLYFHDEGDKDELQRLKSIIFKQLDDLQQTSLLFLKKLQRIKMVFYDKSNRVEKSKEFLKRQVDKYRVALDTDSAKDNETRKESQIYHITTLTAHGLARSDNRDLPNTDDTQTISTSAEVVLAFPLTAEFKPIVNTKKKQEIFAFLPVRESDYKFLIHSDFDTSANRQDIITTSTRNENLLDWIAKAFLTAIKQFCEHSSLCYEWPLFLPNTEGALDTFWAELNIKIRRIVTTSPTLKSRHRRDPRVITDISILTKDATYEGGVPLFDDPDKDPFLSPKYSKPVRSVLKGYGLKNISPNAILEMLESDLRNPNSKMHGKKTDGAWYSAVASLLCSWFDRNYSFLNRLRQLPLIPLRDGKWISAALGPIYFPMTKNIPIPERLDIRVLPVERIFDDEWNRLFVQLGVLEADIVAVRASILRAYMSPNNGLLGSDHLTFFALLISHTPAWDIDRNRACI